jgi:hypothetical protein
LEEIVSRKVDLWFTEDKGKKVWYANIYVQGRRFRRVLGADSEFVDLTEEEKMSLLKKKRDSIKKKIEKDYVPGEVSRETLKKFYPVKIEKEAKIRAEVLADNYRVMRGYLFQQVGIIKELNKITDQTPVVYVVQSDEYFKIGSTCSYDQRMYNIQTSNPRSILVRGLVPTATLQQARYLEEQLQGTFAKYRFHSNTEWFHELPEEYLRTNVILMGGLFLDSDYLVRLDNYKVILEQFDELYAKMKLPTKIQKKRFRDFADEQKGIDEISRTID